MKLPIVFLALSLLVACGGHCTYNPEPEGVFAATERGTQRATPLWPYLVLVASCLFLMDVALRRIDFALLLHNLYRWWVPMEFSRATR